MATTNAAARESRRRKITERGADRLALITGRIETLPSESSSRIPPSDSSPPPSISDPRLQEPVLPPSNQITDSPDDGVTDSMVSTHDQKFDGTCAHTKSCVEALVNGNGTFVEPSRDIDSDVNSYVQSSLSSLLDQQSTVLTSCTEQHSSPPTHKNRIVTPAQISSAIAASKRSRFICSVTIALLVVFSYLEYPLIGKKVVTTIISLRPLYLVLVTNLTLLFTRLLLDNKRDHKKPLRAEHNLPSTGSHDLAAQASKALEAGLVMQKAIDALFMDFSIYVTITVVGLAIISKLPT